MKTRSAKAKGRRLQNKIRDLLLEEFKDLEPDDIRTAIMGETGEDIKLLKNAPVPQGSSLEFMAGNKVVLEATDTVTVDSDTNNSIDAALTIMEIT